MDVPSEVLMVWMVRARFLLTMGVACWALSLLIIKEPRLQVILEGSKPMKAHMPKVFREG